MTSPSSTRVYWLTAAALFVLFGASLVVSALPLGGLAPAISLAIAGVKVTLVALLFMHLRSSSGGARIFAAAGLFWLAILIGLTLVDFATRR